MVTKGSTRFFKYDNARKVFEFHHEISFDDVDEVVSQMRDVVNQSNGTAPSSSSPEIMGGLINSPWIFRKLFGWDSIIKKAT